MHINTMQTDHNQGVNWIVRPLPRGSGNRRRTPSGSICTFTITPIC